MATVAFEIKKDQPVAYSISARRFEIALRAFAIPDEEIRPAWQLMNQCCDWVSHPEKLFED